MDLTRDPIPVLVRRLAVPASVGFFFNTMFNVVDTYFAGLISTQALAGLSLSFPVFFILLAISAGIANGATALVANSLGAGDRAMAVRYSAQACLLGAGLGLGIALLGPAIVPWLLKSLGAKGGGLEAAEAYLGMILAGGPFFVLQMALNSPLQAQGDTRTHRNVLVAGCLLNAVLDPWLMLGGWGLPPMGVRGIALATVVVQALGCLYLARACLRTPLIAGVGAADFRPDLRALGELLKQGLPSSLNMMTVALGVFVITWHVARFGEAAVAAYGVATRVEQIVLLPAIGLNISTLAIAGQNNGAKLFGRVREVWLWSLKVTLSMMAVGGLAIWPLATPLMRLFTSSPEVVEIGAAYLRVAALTFGAYVILYQTVNMLQGLRRPFYAIWLGLYRQILAPIAVFQVLAVWLGWREAGVWWGIFAVTWSAALFTAWHGGRVLAAVEKSARNAEASEAR